MCSRSLFRYIFSPKLKGYRAVRSLSEFCLQSFFLLLLKPERKLKSDKTESRNFDFETKVWDKMPTERETYYLLLSRSIYRPEQTNLGDFRRPISALELFVRVASAGMHRRNGFVQKKGAVLEARAVSECFPRVFSHDSHQSATL